MATKQSIRSFYLGYYRRPHMGYRWCGPSRSQKRLVPIKGHLARKPRKVRHPREERQLQHEFMLLSGLLQCPAVFSRVANVVEKRHFSDEANRTIYTHMLAVHSRGQEVNCMTVHSDIELYDAFKRVGGKQRFLSLMFYTATDANTLRRASAVLGLSPLEG